MKLKICHLNIRSLSAHYIELLNFISVNSYDVITLSETWLNDSIPSAGLCLKDYFLLRRDRSGGLRGGGVAMYIRNTLKFVQLENSATLEDVWVSLKLGNLNLALSCVYKPPKLNCNEFLGDFENLLVNNLLKYDQVFCLGDFNINLMDMSAASTNFLDLLSSVGLKQIVNFPTRVTSHSASLLDLIVVPEDHTVLECGGVHLPNISDHELVYAVFDFDEHIMTMAEPTTYRDIKNINYKQFFSDLKSIPWRNIFDCSTVDDKVEFLNDNLNVLLDIHAPLKIVRLRKLPKPWITDTVKIMIKERDKIFSKFKRSRNPRHFEEYKSMRNFVNKSIEREKKAFLRYNLSQNKNSVWESLNKLNIHTRSKSGEVAAHLSDVDKINNFFVHSIPNIRTNQDVTQYYEGVIAGLQNYLNFRVINEVEVSNILLTIKTGAIAANGLIKH